MLGKRLTTTALSSQEYDLVIVGGGITGAGILQEAARKGLSVLLLEQRDFAWGTSSRSSKMVHGGLRYIAQGDIALTRHSLLERERLLLELPGLVERKHYLFPIRKGAFPGRWSFSILLWLYDFLAGIRDHRWVSRQETLQRAPGLIDHDLKGSMSYTDALTDDARLVIRVLHDGVARGGTVQNYTRVDQIDRGEHNTGFRIQIKDLRSDERTSITTRHVINATGAWADTLSASAERVRPLRGSHIFIPLEKLNLDDCLTILHPDDQRPVFFFPWEGVLCVGTTDLDHKDDINKEAYCHRTELDYLLKVINHQFPQAAVQEQDVISTMAGVRPVISSGKGLDPSKERRDHCVWESKGIISVSGGKLTTFRRIALDALLATGLVDHKEHKQLSHKPGQQFTAMDASMPVMLSSPLDGSLMHTSLAQQLSVIEWVLENEMVLHLDDLLLRRTRLGNLLGSKAEALIDAMEPLCCKHLGWTQQDWQEERARYQRIMEDYYAVPAKRSSHSRMTVE